MAAHYAYLYNCDIIAAGIRVWDTTAYDDATVEYLTKLEQMLEFTGGLENETPKPELYFPLINSHKPIFDFVASYPEPISVLERSWSCWRNVESPCGECAPCVTSVEFMQKLKLEKKG